MRLFAAAFLAISTTAFAAGEPMTWSRSVGGETAAPAPAQGLEAELYGACGPRSLALERVAAAMVAKRANGERPPDGAAVARLVQAAGVATPWPRAWSMVGGDDEVKTRFAGWLAPARGVRRCGVSHGVDGSGRSITAAITVDSLAELARMPRRVRVSSWVTLDAVLPDDASDAAVVLLGPDGTPRGVLASLSGTAARSRFNLDRPGEWTVQLVATLPSGPEPVLEARLFAGVPPAADEEAAAPLPLADVQVLMRSLQAERRDRGLGPLKRSRALDRLAAAHARKMAEKGAVAHDVGDGDPVDRVAARGVGARLVGENVACASDAAAAHRALWESPSHRGNMLAADFGHIGVGVVRAGGSVWVVELFTD